MQSKFIVFFVALIFSSGNSLSQQVQTQTVAISYESSLEIKCGTGIYICVSENEIRALSGRTLKYRHPRGDLGDVKLKLKLDGFAFASNLKDSSEGTWEVRDSKIFFKFAKFPPMITNLVKIQNYLFVQYSGTGTIALVPVEVSTD